MSSLKVYTASRLTSAPLWRRLINEWPEIVFTARWVMQHVEKDGTPKWPHDAAHSLLFWQHDYDDVAAADVVLVYGCDGEHLRGALVEAGIGIALGKTVIVVGDHSDYGTWQYHSSVLRAEDLPTARSLLKLFAMSKR